ncbi:MAG: hypothetical protein M3304_09785 [Actinomycetota bacterium]|nr:hypothetical protein [Actinomycetota bacterium]
MRAFIVAALSVFLLLTIGSLAYLLSTGDQLVECDYTDCGPAGEFANDYGALVLAGFALVSLVAGWVAARRIG